MYVVIKTDLPIAKPSPNIGAIRR